MEVKNSRVCAARGCKNHQTFGSQSFYRFPKDPIRCHVWARKAGCLNLFKTKGAHAMHCSYKLCSDHFSEKCFTSTEKRRLVSFAEPDVFTHEERNSDSKSNMSPELSDCDFLEYPIDSLEAEVMEVIEDASEILECTVRSPMNDTNLSDLCRICAAPTNSFVGIYNEEGKELDLEKKIHNHLPIKVSEEDLLPVQVCSLCIEKLNVCHDLVACCIEANEKLMSLLEETIKLSSEAIPDPSSPMSDAYSIEDNEGPDYIVTSVAEPQSAPLPEIEVANGVIQVPPKKTVSAKCDTSRLPATQSTESNSSARKKRSKGLKIMVVKVVNPKQRKSSLLPHEQIGGNTEKQTADLGEKTNASLNSHKLSQDSVKCSASAKDFLLSMGNESAESIMEQSCLLGDQYYSSVNCGEDASTDLQPEDNSFMVVDIKQEVKKEKWYVDSRELCQETYCCKYCNELCIGKNMLFSHQMSAHSDCVCYCTGCQQLLPIEKKVDHACDNVTGLNSRDNKSKNQSENVEESCEPKYEVTNVAEVYVGSSLPKGLVSGQNTLSEPTVAVNVTKEFGEIEEPIKTKIVGAIQEIIMKRKDFIASGCNTPSITLQGTDNGVLYMCEKCGIAFESKRELKSHKKEQHANKDQHVNEEHICQYCGKIFKQISAVQAHEETHKRRKQYSCTLCSKSFHLGSTLRDHLIKHSQSRPYKCSMCDKSYASKNGLDIHITSHSDERHYLCDLCGKSYKHISNLQSHKRTHQEGFVEKKFKCVDCGKPFRTRMKVEEHRRVHTGERPFICSTCGKTFHKKQQLHQHVAVHSGLKPHKCNVCGARFNRKGNLTEHSKKHNVDKRFTCRICKESFVSISLVLSHRRIHASSSSSDIIMENTAFPCEICGKFLSSKVSLKTHLRIHTGERPYQCGLCGKRFNQKPALDYHYRTHTGERPFVCDFCGKGFNSKLSKDTHQRIHTGEKPFKCTNCGMGFRCTASLNQHAFTHSDSKPFPCPYCHKQFRRRDQLTVHVRIHTGEKPYACEMCGRAFTQRGDMMKHRKVHTHEKSFACQLCGKAFKEKKELKNHEISHSIPYGAVLVGTESLLTAFPEVTVVEAASQLL